MAKRKKADGADGASGVEQAQGQAGEQSQATAPGVRDTKVSSPPTPPAPPARANSSTKCMDGADYQRIHRSKLIEAPYNPRLMDDYAKQGLRDSIRKTGGLIETPVWNRRTGNLVAGHQRLEQTDSLAKGKDYEVTVAVIDVDEKTERELNVRLNNGTIRGIYDVEGIDELLRGGADYQGMGFDLVSLEALYQDAGMELDLAILGGLDSTGLTGVDDPAAKSADDIADTLTEADRAKQAEAEAAKIKAIKDRKKEYIEEVSYKAQSALSVTLVFPTVELKEFFMEFLQQDPAQERLDGIAFCRFLDLDIPEIAKAGGWNPGEGGPPDDEEEGEEEGGEEEEEGSEGDNSAITEDDV